MLFIGDDMERAGCWGLNEGNISCGGLEKEMVFMVCELW